MACGLSRSATMIVFVLGLAWSAAGHRGDAADRPNVVFILADDKY